MRLFRWRHRLPQHATRPRTAASRSPWRDLPFLWVVALATVALLVFMQSLFTQSRHMHEKLGFDKTTIGLLLMINPLLIVLLEMPLVHALRRAPKLPLVALGVLLVGGGMALLAVPNAGMGVVLASILVVVLGEMLWSPQLGAWIGDHAPDDARGSYMGVYAATISLGMILAPWLGGEAYDASPAWLWLGCGLLGAVAALGFLLLHRRRGGSAPTATSPPPSTPAAGPPSSAAIGTGS